MLPCQCLLVVRYFENMHEWNVVVLWSYMIAGYALNGKDEEALKMCWRVLMMGMRLNDFTFLMMLLICAKITDYDYVYVLSFRSRINPDQYFMVRI